MIQVGPGNGCMLPYIRGFKSAIVFVKLSQGQNTEVGSTQAVHPGQELEDQGPPAMEGASQDKDCRNLTSRVAVSGSAKPRVVCM
eukprot:scaffold92619_cov23-Tisochrysis_lutea.AAC.1